MDDFMDSLVKEVEGNIKPIRSEKMDDPFGAPEQPSHHESRQLSFQSESQPQRAQQTNTQPLSMKRESVTEIQNQNTFEEHGFERQPVHQEPPQSMWQQQPRQIYREPAQPRPEPQKIYQESAQPEPQPIYQEPVQPMRQAPQPIYQEPEQPMRQAPQPIYQEPAQPIQQIYREPVQAVQQTPVPQAIQQPEQQGIAAPAAAPAADQKESAPVSRERMDEVEKDLFLHVHRENVKCYRNTQATIIENTNMVKQGLEDKHSNVHSWLLMLLVLSIVNLGASALLILHMIFGFV